MFNSFNLDNKDNIDNIIKNYDKNDVLICKRWANNNKIQYEKFSILISNISKLYNNIFNEMRTINTIISDFNVQNLIYQAVPILTEIYLENILIVKNNIIIQPHDNVKYLLNKYSFRSTLKDEKIIPLLLRSTKNNDKNINIITPKIIYIDNFVIV